MFKDNQWAPFVENYGSFQRHVNLPLQSIVNGMDGMSVNVLYRVAMVHDTTPEQRECTKRTEEAAADHQAKP